MKPNYSVFLALLLCASQLTAQNTNPTRRAIGNLLVENVPEIAPATLERYDQYQNTRAASVADWDASGNGLYISTRFGDVPQVHHVGKAGAYREQITFYREPLAGIQTCPDVTQNGFLFYRDIGGNENFQIYFFDRKTGAPTLLTDGTTRNGNAHWNEKGTKILFSSNKRNGADMDFYLKSVMPNEAPTRILENKGGGWSIADWSDDETKIIVANGISVVETKLFLYSIASRKLEPIHPIAKPIAYSGARFSRDGRGIFLLSDEDSEFKCLRYYDLSSQRLSKIVELNWDIESFELSKDGNTMVFSSNEDGYTQLYTLDTRSMKYQKLANTLPKGVISGMSFNRDNQRLALTLTTSRSPADAYVLNVKTGQAERWTYSEIGGLNAEQFSDCQLLHFPTFDMDEKGKPRQIPTFLYLPKNASPNERLPVVVSIHGGPEGQSFPAFNAFIQYLCNELQVAVLVPNVRGSTGYGKTYVQLDNGFLRENSVKDIGALLDWAEKQPYLDAKRMAVYGGSYGGYMSLASMTHFNERLRCGVDLFGISNFVSFLKNTSAYRADLRRVEYGDERDSTMAAFQQKISPLTNIANITKPMLIYQGENDPRVPLSESEQMVAQLKTKGNAVWYIRAKDEGHGIVKKANRDYTQAAIAQFFKQFLLDSK
jgi:dipeptidyl aminopeptidase/acylaminoacyl peptidase